MQTLLRMISLDGCDVLSVVPFSSLCMPRWSEYCRRITWLRDKSSQQSPFIQLSFVSALDNFPISPHMEGCCSSILKRTGKEDVFTAETDAKNAQEVQRPRDKWSSSLKGSKRQVAHKHQQTSVALSDGFFLFFKLGMAFQEEGGGKPS